MDCKTWVKARMSEGNTRRSLLYAALLAVWVSYAAWEDPASVLDPVKLGAISVAMAGVADGILTKTGGAA